MSADATTTERVTIKDVIFTKVLPNYNIPVSTDGYKIFPCTDCGDKFIFESSYEYHINRKSLKISYFCRYCVKVIVFYNRCTLLAHIRSHAFKTATITVGDIKIEVLPIENFNLSILPTTKQPKYQVALPIKNPCHECNKNISKLGIAYKDRAAHYAQKSDQTHMCPICLYEFPSLCALEAHLRIHLNVPPYFCPECGMHLQNKVSSYPFDHHCKSFKKMKSAARLSCKLDDCGEIFHANDYRTHIGTHVKKVYRCTFCLEVMFDEQLNKCSLCKIGNLTCYTKCPLCPNKLFADSIIEKHLDSHGTNTRHRLSDQCYPCTACNEVYKQMFSLINHHVDAHSLEILKTLLSKFLVKASSSTAGSKTNNKRNVYHRVVKKCSTCLRSFTYRCLYKNIARLPNDCPYKCTANSATQSTVQPDILLDNMPIKCYICQEKILQDWNSIKEHFASAHNQKFLDIHVLVERLYKRKLPKKSRNKNKKSASVVMKSRTKKNKIQVKKTAIEKKKEDLENPNVCIICNCNCENSKGLESHLITHRDPCMAYQCLECGQCFVVKPSFSTHLLLEHDITDVQRYIDTKPCYNESALLKNETYNSPHSEQPVKENQCTICRDHFKTHNDLKMHFRVHGMAFLKKNAHKNSNSP